MAILGVALVFLEVFRARLNQPILRGYGTAAQLLGSNFLWFISEIFLELNTAFLFSASDGLSPISTDYSTSTSELPS